MIVLNCMECGRIFDPDDRSRFWEDNNFCSNRCEEQYKLNRNPQVVADTSCNPEEKLSA
jgi:ribosomal protein L24E